MLRFRFARIADALFFVFLALTAIIGLTGGIRFGQGWYRITATTPTHTLEVAFAIVLLRHLIVRQPSLRQRLTARRLARAPGVAATLDLAPLGRTRWLVASVVMIAATLLLLKDQAAMIAGVPDRGDPLFSMWRLAWVSHQLVTDPRHLFDANIFHPATNTLAYSDATLLPGLAVAPFLWLGVPVAVIHGLLYLASFALAGLAMFWLARVVTGQTGPALVAGLLFAFYPYRFSTYSHLEMQGVFLMPLALLFLLRALATGRTRDGVALGLSVALELLWSLYLGAYLAVGLGVVLFARWLGGHYRLRDRLRVLGAAFLVLAAIAGPYSWPYWSARGTVGDRPRDETRSFSARPIDYVTINQVNAFYRGHLHRVTNAERELFPGTTTIVLAGAALLPPVTPVAAAAGAGLVVAIDASLGLNGATFRWLYDLVPPFRAFRVPARFGMLVGLFATLLAGVGLARLLHRRSNRTRAILSTLVLAFAGFELRPELVLTPTPVEQPPIYGALPSDPALVLVDLPLPVDDSEYWVDPTYLYYSTFHWRRLLNGYSGFTPPWYSRLMVATRELPSDESIDVFRSRGAQFLILHEEFYPTDRYKEVSAALDQRRDLHLISVQRSAAGEARLYQIRR